MRERQATSRALWGYQDTFSYFLTDFDCKNNNIYVLPSCHQLHLLLPLSPRLLSEDLFSDALSKRNRLIISSSTIAELVLIILSPSFRTTSSPPAAKPMYCSPIRPEVRILAKVSFGNL